MQVAVSDLSSDVDWDGDKGMDRPTYFILYNRLDSTPLRHTKLTIEILQAESREKKEACKASRERRSIEQSNLCCREMLMTIPDIIHYPSKPMNLVSSVPQTPCVMLPPISDATRPVMQ